MTSLAERQLRLRESMRLSESEKGGFLTALSQAALEGKLSRTEEEERREAVMLPGCTLKQANMLVADLAPVAMEDRRTELERLLAEKRQREMHDPTVPQVVWRVWVLLTVSGGLVLLISADINHWSLNSAGVAGICVWLLGFPLAFAVTRLAYWWRRAMDLENALVPYPAEGRG